MKNYVIFFIILTGFGGLFSPKEEPELLNEKNLKGLSANLEAEQIATWVEQKEEISLLFTGDVMCHGTQLRSAYDKSSGNYDFSDVFLPIQSYVQKADYAVVNFETVTAGEAKGYRGYPTFNTPDIIVENLKDVGFDLFLTANNHCLDVGKYGLERTIDVIQKAGLDQIGTYKNELPKPFFKEIKGAQFAFLNYTYGCNGMESAFSEATLERMVNLIDEEKIKKDILLAREKADMVIVLLHWGNEYQRIPSSSQKSLAQSIFDAGADVIIGGHPHVIQPSTWVNGPEKDKFILYSLGNLVSNQRRETLVGFPNNEYTEDGLLLNLHFERNVWTEEIQLQEAEYEPLWVNRFKNEEGDFDFQILPTREYLEDSHGLDEKTWNKVKESFSHTMDIMDVKQTN